MTTTLRALASISLAVILTACALAPAGAICVPFPCVDCNVLAAGQINLVVMDREAGRVRLVPNIRFTGDSPIVALIVPTPSLPLLSPTDKALWTEASALTAPLNSSRGNSEDSFGCGSTSQIQPDAGGFDNFGEDDDVVVHSRQIVGQFEATIVSSENSGALTAWLRDNGFAISTSDADRFAPFVARGWYFTAMKMDTTDAANRMPFDGWNAQVNPVVVDYAADTFELPLPILTINMAASLPIVVYVVDEHRTEITGFSTDYSNRISASEYAAIGNRYPTVAGFLEPGRTLTRLRRTFTDPGSMTASIMAREAATDDEFRILTRLPVGYDEGRGAGDGFPADLLLIGIPAVVLRARARRRSARRPAGG